MATIIECDLWSVSEEVANHMVETGLLIKCESNNHYGLAESDLPIYHRSPFAPTWFGTATMAGAIAGAERAVEKEGNDSG